MCVRLFQVVTCLYSGARYGYLGTRIAACPAFRAGGGGGWGALNPLQALRPLQAVVCWALTTGDVMLGVRCRDPSVCPMTTGIRLLKLKNVAESSDSRELPQSIS